MEGRKLYTISGEVLNEEDIMKLPYIDRGSEGDVYRLGEDKVIKVLDGTYEEEDFDKINTIKNLRLPNIYHIYDLLVEENSSSKLYVGNISKYYTSEDVDLWMMPSSWLIENFQNLTEAAIILGENKIYMFDCAPHNVILSKDGITLIDADFYYKTYLPCIEGNLRNMNICLFSTLLYENYSSHHGESKDNFPLEQILGEFFYPDCLPSEKKDFVKTLSKYPKPMDYLHERLKK